MAKITSRVVKTWAKDLGANIVGIASADRFEGAPPGHGPKDFVPEARSVIVAGIRIPDPVVDYSHYHLGFQDMPSPVAVRTTVNNIYMVMGHYTIDWMLNALAIQIANRLEIEGGYKSFTPPNTSNVGLTSTVTGFAGGIFSQRHAATRAGLGEFGLCNIVLTPEFGPRLRLVSVITEAELEPDPLITEKICLREKCGGNSGPKCLQVCSPHAIQFREGVDRDAIFIDPPSKTDPALCVKWFGGEVAFQCTFVGSCMEACPVKLDLEKVRAANR